MQVGLRSGRVSFAGISKNAINSFDHFLTLVEFKSTMQKCTNRRFGKMIGMYEFGALDTRDERAFMNHVIECEYCHNQLYSLEPFSTAFRIGRRNAQDIGARKPVLTQRTPWFQWPFKAMLPIAVTVLLAMGAGGLVAKRMLGPKSVTTGGVQDGGEARRETIARITVQKPAYNPPEKGTLLRGGEKAFANAMAAYQREEFDSAIEQLQVASELQPRNGGEVSFYLGACLLLVNRSQEAVWPLRHAAEIGDSSLTEKARYYVALAYLKGDDAQRATAEVDAVVAMNGEYLTAAQQLKQQILGLPK
jgi:hypothetical protein